MDAINTQGMELIEEVLLANVAGGAVECCAVIDI